MEIEKEIASNKFENNHQKAMVNLLYTYGWLTNILRSKMCNFDVSLQQFNILRILRGSHPKPVTINMLKERMLDKMPDASRIVDRLVQKDLVMRRINEKDRRFADIFITGKGLGLLSDMDKEVSTSHILKDTLTEKEAIILNKLLDKLRG